MRSILAASLLLTAPLAAQARPDSTATDSVRRLPELEVVAERDPYRAPVSSFGSKLDLSPLDIPQSVGAVTREAMDDRQAVDLRETIRGVSGINFGRSATTELVIRGFNDNGSVTNFGASGGIYQINGLRNYLTDYVSDVQLVNVERVEVLKGSSGVLYGFNQPGGVVNLVTKAPLARPRYQVSIAGGTWERYRLTADATGPLTRDGRLLYRLNVGWITSPDYRDVNFNRNLILAPSLAFQAGPRTRIVVDGLVTRSRRLAWFDWGIPTRDADGVPILDRVSDQYSPHQQGDDTRLTAAGALATLTHDFSPALRFTSGVSLSGNDVVHQGHYPDFSPPDTAGDVPLLYRTFTGENRGVFASNYLTARLRTGGLDHELVAGVDLFSGSGSGIEISASNSSALPDNIAPANVYQPATAGLGPAGEPRLVSNYVFNGGYNYYERIGFVGVYLQDLVTVASRLKLLLGLRYDRHRAASGLGAPDVVNEPINPNLGAVYQPAPSVALYASFTQGFLPQLTQDPDLGGPFDPLYSRQVEAGVKTLWLDGRLSATASVYRIRRVNQLISAGDPAAPERLEQTGQTTSDGVELDFVGSPVPGISMILNYAYNNARVTISDDPDAIGRRLPNAPRHMGALWTRYARSRGPLAGLGLGFGVNLVGERLGGFSYTSYPAYTTLDAAVWYPVGHVTLALNGYNLGNRQYVAGIYSDFYAQRGQLRNVMLSASMTY
jgi:iron complex outermembrane receptor protein